MFSFMGGVKDAYNELKDLVVVREEASDDLINAPTPTDRWFTPPLGWPMEPQPMPSQATPAGYALQPWEPPPLLCPTRFHDNPSVGDLFEQRQRKQLVGELYIEVLQAEGLPNSVLQGGAVDPYAVVVFEGCAARTSQVRNDTTPRWGAETPRAFKFDVRCPYSMVHVAVFDDDRMRDDPLGRVVIDIWNFVTDTTYDCWWPLQYGVVKRHVRARGAVRLRICVVWQHDRKFR